MLLKALTYRRAIIVHSNGKLTLLHTLNRLHG